MIVKKILHLISRIFFNVMVIVFGIGLIGGTILNDKNVADLLTENVFKDKPGDVVVSTGKEKVRYKSWYSTQEDLLNGNGEIAYAAELEGATLLKNQNNALPLSEGEKVSLYGVTAYDPMYNVDGAGNSMINDPQAYNGNSEVYRRQFFYDEFEKAGLKMNKKLADWYNSPDGIHYRRRDFVGFWGKGENNSGYNGNKNGYIPALTEAMWNEVPEDAKNAGDFDHSSTAIYITGRMGNEAIDLTNVDGGAHGNVDGRNNDGEGNPDYLALTNEEKDLIKNLGLNYDKVIVIFNQANPPQSDIPAILDECGIEAAMWIGFPGSDGIKAIADLLIGKYSPSGSLSAAWYTSRNNNPSTQNYGISSQSNVVNVEGVYVGYRYAETRYEDILSGSDKAGEYDYATQISYPFGYGLSYTDFDYSDISLMADPDPAKNYYTGGLMAANDENYHGNYGKKRPAEELRKTGTALGDCDDIIMEVTVKNTGSKPGKETVQVYLSQPITEKDRAHKVEKPSVQLVGYGKTKVLGPNESETLQIKIDANKWFAAYDARENGYVLSAGDYLLTAARNSHEAVNSILRYKGKNLENESFVGDYGDGNANNVKSVAVSEERSKNYKYWTQGTRDEVTNLFDDIDPNMDDKSDNDVLYFSRYDWENTAKIQENGRIGQDGSNISGAAKGATDDFNSGSPLSAEKISNFENYYSHNESIFNNEEYTFGWSNTDWQLADLVGVEYDPARGATEEDIKKWNELLGQLTESDFKMLLNNGQRKTAAIPSIAKPGTNDQNASNGFEWPINLGSGDNTGKFGNKNSYYGFKEKFDKKAPIAYSIGYPCEGIRAATFNNDLGELVGNAMGEDGLWTGASGLYGFGLGMQRNPYHGRAGEFYSDDPYLTGAIGGYETKGAQEKGLYVYNKHFVLNDQDTNRSSYSSWLNEQTLRQTYLRPFEMAVEIGDMSNVMVAFNEFGDAWTGTNYNLMTRWLKGEAGMAGFAISDWAPSHGENLACGMLAGMSLLDGSGGGYSAGIDARYDNELVKNTQRILYTVANSNAMNFIGDDVKIYTFDPPWYKTRDNILLSINIIFAISAVFLAATSTWVIVDNILSKRKNNTTNE